ncbi:MAG: hypothetical protein AAB786_00270 [Patescibacteria group bacterium]
MKISNHLDRNNLHHAYLIEGAREEIVPEIFAFIQSLGIKVIGNADVSHISLDTFKIEDARNLKSFGSEKGFSNEKNAKKIFIVSVNNFLLEAQNSLLKMFEEPIENTHFFLVVPEVNALLKTFVSRFYVVFARQDLAEEQKDAEKFINMSLKNRIDFMKDLLAESKTDGENNPSLDSARSKALIFLNSLEFTLRSKLVNNFADFTLPGVPGGTYAAQNSLQTCFSHLFKVREFLRMPGSSTKTLMESVALVVPSF